MAGFDPVVHRRFLGREPGPLAGRLAAIALIRRSSRTSAGEVAGFTPSGTCGPSQ
jgi:hypothetical protein